MSASAAEPAVDAVEGARTPADLLAQVRADRAKADAAEARVIQLAVEWAHAHPVLEGDEAWRPWRAKDVEPAEPLGRLCGSVAGLELTGDPVVDAETEELIAWAGIPQVRWDAPPRSPRSTGCRPTPGSS